MRGTRPISNGEERMIPIVIPAYEPDERMLQLLETLVAGGQGPVVIVDDGSGDAYKEIFEKAGAYVRALGGAVLTHEVNRGKGRALKTAFAYILSEYPEAAGCVTADSDGQHTAECIDKVMETLRENPDSLVLGVRRFDGENVPWRSRMGNGITERVFAYVSGVHVTDTQTGLRGIPRAFMKELLDVPGERFEFETQMLLECAGSYPVIEVPIQTIYDSKENHQTHFNTFTDSVKIYRILAKKFMKYVFASFSSCVLDLVLFTIFCSMLKGKTGSYVAAATVLARVISATCNYALNYKVVFESKQKVHTSGVRYFLLAAVQMGLSAFLVTAGCSLISTVPETAVKVVVDGVLFFISYAVQQRYVF